MAQKEGLGCGFRGFFGLGKYAGNQGAISLKGSYEIVYTDASYSQYFPDNQCTGVPSRGCMKDYTKLREGPLCPVLRAPYDGEY